jgi:NAD-reducing hydrogenase small subunit
MTKARLATMWLDGCSGCHMSLLDIDEAIVAIAGRAELVYGPLVDAQKFPDEVDVTIIEGAVSSNEDLEKVRHAREHTHILVALGDCAVTSNVPAMRNRFPVKTIMERVYVEGADVQKGVPDQNVPVLLKNAVPLHEVVKVDVFVPGCPPAAPAILYVLNELLDGRIPDLKAKVRFG